jgi:hypothetical protein
VPEQIAAPKQAVSVKISDGERAMQRLGLSGWLIRRLVKGAIESALNNTRQREPCRDQNDEEQQKDPAQEFHGI